MIYIMISRAAVLVLLLVLLLQHESDGWRRRRRRRSPPPCRPVNCQVGPWSKWSSCTQRCGSSGTQHRIRAITKPAACGGQCPYSRKEVTPCNRDACQNGGTPAADYCKCVPGYKGTCCEIVIPATTPTKAQTTKAPTTVTTEAPTACLSPSCDGGYLPHTKCMQDYVKAGAFKEDISRRVMPVLLLTDRDCSSAENDGHKLDWHKFEESIHSLACRCSVLTKKRGWKVFGLQNYAECWSGPSADKTFDKYGQAGPQDSVQIMADPTPPCEKRNPQECIGKDSINYVYLL